MQAQCTTAITTCCTWPAAWLHGSLAAVQVAAHVPTTLQKVSRKVKRLPVLRDTEGSHCAVLQMSSLALHGSNLIGSVT